MPFDLDIHYPIYKAWAEGWGVEPASVDQLPQLGWIMNGCVIGFLARADGRIGIACHLISDPKASKLKVVEAGLLLQDQILVAAEYIGLARIIAATERKSVAKAMLAAGWQQFPYHYMEKVI